MPAGLQSRGPSSAPALLSLPASADPDACMALLSPVPGACRWSASAAPAPAPGWCSSGPGMAASGVPAPRPSCANFPGPECSASKWWRRHPPPPLALHASLRPCLPLCLRLRLPPDTRAGPPLRLLGAPPRRRRPCGAPPPVGCYSHLLQCRAWATHPWKRRFDPRSTPPVAQARTQGQGRRAAAWAGAGAGAGSGTTTAPPLDSPRSSAAPMPAGPWYTAALLKLPPGSPSGWCPVGGASGAPVG